MSSFPRKIAFSLWLGLSAANGGFGGEDVLVWKFGEGVVVPEFPDPRRDYTKTVVVMDGDKIDGLPVRLTFYVTPTGVLRITAYGTTEKPFVYDTGIYDTKYLYYYRDGQFTYQECLNPEPSFMSSQTFRLTSKQAMVINELKIDGAFILPKATHVIAHIPLFQDNVRYLFISGPLKIPEVPEKDKAGEPEKRDAAPAAAPPKKDLPGAPAAAPPEKNSSGTSNAEAEAKKAELLLVEPQAKE